MCCAVGAYHRSIPLLPRQSTSSRLSRPRGRSPYPGQTVKRSNGPPSSTVPRIAKRCSTAQYRVALSYAMSVPCIA
eukprot:2678812-Rhodomonas_salina.1